MTSFYKCWPISRILGKQRNELICNITVIYLPISPTYSCYTILGNINCCPSLVQKVWQGTLSSFSMKLLKFIPPDFWPPSSPDQTRGMMQDRVYQTPVWDMPDLRQRLINKALWTMLLTNGGRDFRLVWMKWWTFWTLAIVNELELRLVVQINWMLLQTATVMCNYDWYDYALDFVYQILEKSVNICRNYSHINMRGEGAFCWTPL